MVICADVRPFRPRRFRSATRSKPTGCCRSSTATARPRGTLPPNRMPRAPATASRTANGDSTPASRTPPGGRLTWVASAWFSVSSSGTGATASRRGPHLKLLASADGRRGRNGTRTTVPSSTDSRTTPAGDRHETPRPLADPASRRTFCISTRSGVWRPSRTGTCPAPPRPADTSRNGRKTTGRPRRWTGRSALNGSDAHCRSPGQLETEGVEVSGDRVLLASWPNGKARDAISGAGSSANSRCAPAPVVRHDLRQTPAGDHNHMSDQYYGWWSRPGGGCMPCAISPIPTVPPLRASANPWAAKAVFYGRACRTTPPGCCSPGAAIAPVSRNSRTNLTRTMSRRTPSITCLRWTSPRGRCVS